jgi:hypothetical protein
MPLSKIVLRPGIDRQSSQTAGEGGWWDSNRVRFRGGVPEKMGGWQRLSSVPLDGRVRALAAWNLLSGEAMLAAGSHTKLYLWQGGAYFDVTPLARTRAISNGIATTAGSAAVTITFTSAHGALDGDIFTFDTLSGVSRVPWGASVGGVPLSGDLTVTRVVSATAVEITAAAPAASTVAAGGGSATATFFLPSGRPDQTPGQGYGAGAYSRGGYGGPADVAAVVLAARFWSLDAWGEALLAVPLDGSLYSWAPGAGGTIGTRAARVVSGVAADGPPLRIGRMLVAMPQRQVLLLGASALNSESAYDPMLVRWSDIEDFAFYRAAADNAAGSVRLQGGTEIRAGFNTQLQTLIWTDTTLHGLRFIGQPLIYRVDILGRSCGIIGPKAFAEVNSTVYWMGEGNFWQFRGGAPELLRCAIWDDVFGNLNREQRTKVVCAGNSDFGEVIWFYPSSGSLEPDRFAAYNTIEGVWYGGVLTRTAWLDRGVLPYPVGSCWNTRLLYAHETGLDADGAAMGEWIESGWVDLDDGEMLTHLEKLLPDWRRLVGQARLTVRVVDYPLQPPRVRGPFVVDAATTQVVVRARGRQVALRIDGDVAPGGVWRLGAMRAKAQSDGKVA